MNPSTTREEELEAILSAIASRAGTMSSRLMRGGEPADDAAASDARVRRWVDVVGFGDETRWRRRLAWEGLDEVRVRAVLAQGEAPESKPPSWIATLRALLGECGPGDESLLDAANPIPFERALLPLVAAASAFLDRAPHGDRALLSPQARASLERALLERLAFVTHKTLAAELVRARPYGETILAVLSGNANGSTTRYDAFVEELCDRGWLQLFIQYPVLARLVSVAVEQWVNAAREFLGRLAIDAPMLRESFGAFGRVVQLDATLSDPHRGGRTVVALTFENGAQVLYKPKDLGLDHAYAELCAWINARSTGLSLRAPRMLHRGHYGWVEYIVAAPCADEAAVRRFYERAGMQLFLVYALGGTDCHAENVIAMAEQMVLVDLETLLHPEAPSLVEEAGSFDSVLRSGLLPRWECRQDTRHVVDLSGLGFVEAQRAPKRRWRHVNTDDMHLAWESDVLDPRGNAPSLNGEVRAPDGCIAEIVAGFEKAHVFFCSRKEELLAPGGPLAAFANQRVRFIFRATKLYFSVLDNALAPEYLKDGRDFGIELEHVAFAFLGAREKPTAWPLLAAELAALEQLDVPYFDTDSSGAALNVGERPLEGYFKSSGCALLAARIARLDDADRRLQVDIIRSTVFTRTADTHRIEASEAPGLLAASSALDRQALLDEARAIGDTLAERAVRVVDGCPNWLGLVYVRNTERFQVNLMPANLYDGIGGVALFLATLGEIAGDVSFKQLAAQAFRPLRSSLRPERERAERLARRLGVGGAMGIGSLVYALVRTFALTGESELLEDAHAAAGGVADAIIDNDAALDVMAGSAGLALGLTTLHAAAPTSRVVTAIACAGDRLVGTQIGGGDFDGAWPSADGSAPQTGFSHGAAGVAYALARIYAVTGVTAHAEACKRGLAYERRRFGAKDDPRATPMVSWCHGPAGAALARVGALRVIDDAGLREDAAAVLEATAAAGVGGLDSLCCGNLGRVDTLLAAHAVLGGSHRATAEERASALLASARAGAGFRLKSRLATGEGLFNPALFQGASGIGYELLRLAEPARVPSVLLWD